MADGQIDLKQLVHLIYENKDMAANLCLDEGCRIHAEDPKPLVKVINYLINVLKELTELPLEISLDLHDDGCTLGLMALNPKNEIPSVSEHLSEALETYQAALETVHEKERYLLFKLKFRF